MINNYKDILKNCKQGVCTFSAMDKLSLQTSSIPNGYGVYNMCQHSRGRNSVYREKWNIRKRRHL